LKVLTKFFEFFEIFEILETFEIFEISKMLSNAKQCQDEEIPRISNAKDKGC